MITMLMVKVKVVGIIKNKKKTNLGTLWTPLPVQYAPSTAPWLAIHSNRQTETHKPDVSPLRFLPSWLPGCLLAEC